MRYFMIISAICYALHAQGATITVTGPTANQKAGTVVSLSVNLSNSVNSGAQSVQFTLPLAWNTAATVGVGQIGKQVSCATVGANLTCMVWGLNQSFLADGQLANLMVTIPATTPAGTLTLVGSNMIAANTDATGNVGTSGVAAGTPFSLSITSANGCDLTGDNLVNMSDANIVVPQALGAVSCTTGDLNKDGKCNVADVQIVANAAGGAACTAK